ncbi:hypothetical protein I7I48_01232 [Histoplasma ohiense]|nr:hypothetical protein I7I48_01232 [Histoplasma ohiense (nom. inval.)]
MDNLKREISDSSVLRTWICFQAVKHSFTGVFIQPLPFKEERILVGWIEVVPRKQRLKHRRA